MTKELKRLSLIMVLMFFGLFAANSWIQVVQAQTLAENPENRRTLYDSFEVQRGSIIAGDEVVDHVPDGMTVVSVETLAEAYDAVVAIGAGRGATLPGCS